jgi:hypothetical protein
MYGITIHFHAPEFGTHYVHQSKERDANEYHVMLTLSWNSWTLTKDKYDKPVYDDDKILKYERHFAGDHWQIIQPVKNVKKQLWMTESAASAAGTDPKKSQNHQKLALAEPKRLSFTFGAEYATAGQERAEGFRKSNASSANTAATAPNKAKDLHRDAMDAPKPLAFSDSATDKSDPVSVQFMLREVSGSSPT